MKKNYILIALITLLCANTDICLGQNSSAIEIKGLSFTILDMVHGINSKVDSFYTAEKADSFNKNLASFKVNIQQYLTSRKSLMLYLAQNKYETNTNTAKAKIAIFQNRLEVLLERMIFLSAFVNAGYYKNANDIYGAVMYNQQPIRSVTKLQDLIDGKKVDQKLLKNAGDIVTEELKLSILMISQLQYKISQKEIKPARL